MEIFKKSYREDELSQSSNFATNFYGVNFYLGLFWWLVVTTFVASSFYIAGPFTLTKIGFAIFFVGFLVFRFARVNEKIPLCWVDASLLGFFFYSGLSVLWAGNIVIAFSHYTSMISCLVLYFLARSVMVYSPRRVNFFFLSLIFSALVSSFFGFLQFGLGRFFVPGTESRSMTTGDSFRANGLFDDPNYFGYLLTMAWPLVFYVFKENKFLRNFIVGVLFLAIVATFSRATLLIFFLQVIFLNFLRSDNFFKVFFRLFFSLSALVFFLVVFNLFDVQERLVTLVPVFFDNGEELDNSSAERLDLLISGVSMFLDNILLGVGFGNFQLRIADYMTFFPREVYAHNTYVTVAAESGIIGFATYLTFLVTIFFGLLRRKQFYVLVSFFGLLASNFFLVAHYFPIAYLYFAAVAGVCNFQGSNEKTIAN